MTRRLVLTLSFAQASLAVASRMRYSLTSLAGMDPLVRALGAGVGLRSARRRAGPCERRAQAEA
eukprot:4668126-Pleurochrysis_carterae.AAC.1